MNDAVLLQDLIAVATSRAPESLALTVSGHHVRYGDLHEQVLQCASGLLDLGLGRGERVGIYLEKRAETVVTSFGAPAAGGVFVPLNPLLKAEQVVFILRWPKAPTWRV